jgi:DNA-binding GntR family transcriptional regulator
VVNLLKSDHLTAPLVSENLAQLAFERLEGAIMSGEMAPGEKISESLLARRLNISRGPLREAIGRLEGLGLVTRIAKQGPRVTALDEKELMDLLVLREAVEGMACRYAAINATNAELKRLEKLLDRHEQDPTLQAGVGYFQGHGDLDFHFQLAQASRNAKLYAFVCGPLYSVLRLYRHRASSTPGRPQKAFEEHKEILAALRARDPDRAEAAMRSHIRNSRENVRLAIHAHQNAEEAEPQPPEKKSRARQKTAA